MTHKRASYKRLLRIKVWGKPVLSFAQSLDKEDFYLFYPTITQDKYAVSGHATFHSKTGRITFKTTSIKDSSVEILPSILSQADGRAGFENAVGHRDLDLFKGKILSFDDPNTSYPWFSIAFNMGKTDPSTYFKKGRSSDGEYMDIWNIDIPKEHNDQVTFNVGISKSKTQTGETVFENGIVHRRMVLPNHLDDEYAFTFNANFQFPKV